ncbi:MAG TPA: hypothetical protein VFE47_09310 [Tepidisphaeraceae bacterium]|nr:hypothetical protein [Tepidisphaeraceae bacterium]
MLESNFQRLFELAKKVAAFGNIGNVNENSGEVVTVGSPLVSPVPLNGLRLGGNRAESLLDREQRRGNQLTGNSRPVIEP